MHWGIKMMDTDKSTDTTLEALFSEARAQPPELPDGLLARVTSDALALQPAPRRIIAWRDWIAGIGGVPGAAALVTASCVGFWIGLVPPDGIADLADTVWDSATIEEDFSDAGLNGFGWDSGEG